ncbi:MAG: hypothetical protein ABSE27_00585 [Acidobacteriaceae bacterium]|jgi:hypothetical protein
MDISAIDGEDLKSVEFVEDYLQLRFGEPEYRNALCAQIGETVEKAILEEGDALTVEFANGIVFALSLREEDVDSPESGSYSVTGDEADAQEF